MKCFLVWCLFVFVEFYRSVQGKKNVLYIVVDDLRPQFGAYGQGYMHTPNIDSLANRSLIFDRAYCQFAFCAPSRNSFMTGRRPDRTQCWNFIDNFREVGPNWISMPQYFKENGYFTSGVGKLYHPDLPPNGDPPSWSDDINFPYINPPYISCPNFTAWCNLDPSQHYFSDLVTLDIALRRMRHASNKSKSAILPWCGIPQAAPAVPITRGICWHLSTGRRYISSFGQKISRKDSDHCMEWLHGWSWPLQWRHWEEGLSASDGWWRGSTSSKRVLCCGQLYRLACWWARSRVEGFGIGRRHNCVNPRWPWLATGRGRLTKGLCGQRKKKPQWICWHTCMSTPHLWGGWGICN